jgi:outer membrane lipoprotein-sorting protein
MKTLLLTLAILATTAPLRADDPAAILTRVDQFRNPIDSFSIDVELTAISGTKSDTQKYRVYGRGPDRSVVEFIWPQTEKGKYLLMLRDAMWFYLPSASRPIRISPLQRLAGQASNGDVARTSFTADYTATIATPDGDAWRLDLVAKDPAVAYARIQLWVDKTTYEPRRADFYVTSGKLIKRAWYREFGVMDGRNVVTAIEIEDLLRTGNRTLMHYSALTARDNPERMFTKEGFSR